VFGNHGVPAPRAAADRRRGVMRRGSVMAGALAESTVSMRKQIGDLQTDVHGLRTDVHMISIAVDQHTARLDLHDA
jgi:hypothetical protein